MARTLSAQLCIPAALAIAVALGGCESIERETGLNRDTQTGVLGGAAIGGVIASIAGASPTWIAASAILGGVGGGVLGKALGRQDAEKHAETNWRAVDTLGEGQSERWSDSRSGNSGRTTVTKVFVDRDSRQCKTYTETVITGTQTVTKDATACRTNAGWQLANR